MEAIYGTVTKNIIFSTAYVQTQSTTYFITSGVYRTTLLRGTVGTLPSALRCNFDVLLNSFSPFIAPTVSILNFSQVKDRIACSARVHASVRDSIPALTDRPINFGTHSNFAELSPEAREPFSICIANISINIRQSDSFRS